MMWGVGLVAAGSGSDNTFYTIFEVFIKGLSDFGSLYGSPVRSYLLRVPKT